MTWGPRVDAANSTVSFAWLGISKCRPPPRTADAAKATKF